MRSLGFLQVLKRVDFVPGIGIKKDSLKGEAAVGDHFRKDTLVKLVHSACSNMLPQSQDDLPPRAEGKTADVDRFVPQPFRIALLAELEFPHPLRMIDSHRAAVHPGLQR